MAVSRADSLPALFISKWIAFLSPSLFDCFRYFKSLILRETFGIKNARNEGSFRAHRLNGKQFFL